jgi:hypothetical protein
MSTTISHVDAVRQAVREFERVQRERREFGACDTEPDGQFQVRMHRAAHGLRPTAPQGSAGWELFSGMKGVRSAASRLTAACDAVIKAIESCPISEREDLMAYIRDYCWRVY